MDQNLPDLRVVWRGTFSGDPFSDQPGDASLDDGVASIDCKHTSVQHTSSYLRRICVMGLLIKDGLQTSFERNLSVEAISTSSYGTIQSFLLDDTSQVGCGKSYIVSR